MIECAFLLELTSHRDFPIHIGLFLFWTCHRTFHLYWTFHNWNCLLSGSSQLELSCSSYPGRSPQWVIITWSFHTFNRHTLSTYCLQGTVYCPWVCIHVESVCVLDGVVREGLSDKSACVQRPAGMMWENEPWGCRVRWKSQCKCPGIRKLMMNH